MRSRRPWDGIPAVSSRQPKPSPDEHTGRPFFRERRFRPAGVVYLSRHMGFRVLTVAAVLLGWALPAIAQESVKLQFNAGQVTLSVQNAPVRVILAEWARLGRGHHRQRRPRGRPPGDSRAHRRTGAPGARRRAAQRRRLYTRAPSRGIARRLGVRPYPGSAHERRAQESAGGGGRVGRPAAVHGAATDTTWRRTSQPGQHAR